MKLIKDFGSLKATIIDDADGVNIYVTNNITESEHLFVRLNYSSPLMDMYLALNKIKKSADELNDNFKQL